MADEIVYKTVARAPTRKPFSREQLVQARTAGIITPEHRAQRRYQATHAIDDLPPEEVADRDDGIFVEVEPNGFGGVTAHITIADVGAHIPAGSPLASIAYERGSTLYNLAKGAHNTMLPLEVERRVSLEHQQERLGLNIKIEMDGAYKPVHTEFERVITHPDNADYEMAEAFRSSRESFALMHRTAEAIRREYFGKQEVLERELKAEKSGQEPNESPKMRKYNKDVESFMLLANEVVASFMAKSQLPFIYRNFDRESEDEEGVARATYDPQWRAHRQLKRHGLHGAYSHVTSPIRRGADLINAHLMHDAIRLLEVMEGYLLQRHPHWTGESRQAVHRALWDHGSALLAEAQAMQRASAPSERMEAFRRLDGVFSDVAQQAGVARVELKEFTLMPLLRAHHPSYSADELAEFCTRINQLNRHDAMIRQQAAQAMGIAQASPEPPEVPANVDALDKTPFSHLLRKAALSGTLDQRLAAEAVKRFRAGTLRNRRFDVAQDGFTVLLMAQYPHDTRWRVLKKELCRSIKHDPQAVNAILGAASQEKNKHYPGYIAPEALHYSVAALPVEEAELTEGARRRLYYAQLVEDAAPHQITPQTCSVGFDKRAAYSHAKYAFLEAKAFGELVPLEESYLPNILYAELNHSEADKGVLLKTMLAEVGASLATDVTEHGDQMVARGTISGGVFAAPLTLEAAAPSSEEALQRLYRHVLRDPVVKDKVANRAPLTLYQESAPQKQLESWVATQRPHGHQWEMQIKTSQHGAGAEAHHAKVTLFTDHGAYRYQASAPNRDRAVNAACLMALKAHHPEVECCPSPVRRQPGSWVKDVQTDQARTPMPTAPHTPWRGVDVTFRR